MLNNKKRLMNFVKVSVISLLMLGFTGCGFSKKGSGANSLKAWMQPSEKIKVLSTTQMIDDLVEVIGGDHVIHMALITGQLDPHSYELVKGDDEKLSCADVIIYNGLDLEHGATLRERLEAHKASLSLGEALAKNKDVSLVFINGQVDPHIWMDVELFSKSIDPIVEKLSKADPQHANDYQAHGDALKAQMITLDQKIKNTMHSLPESKRYLVTTHDAFFYFARAYLCDENNKEAFLEHFAAPEGLAPDVQMSSQDLKRIMAYIDQHHIKYIFSESNLSKDALLKISTILKQQGTIVTIAPDVLFADAMGDEHSKASKYLDMMEYNVQTIYHYLSQE